MISLVICTAYCNVHTLQHCLAHVISQWQGFDKSDKCGAEDVDLENTLNSY